MRISDWSSDVCSSDLKQDGLPDYTPNPDAGSMGGDEASVPYWGQPGVHEIYRDWHMLLAEYDGDRALCAEAWMPSVAKTDRKSVVSGKSVSVRVDLGGRRIFKKKHNAREHENK